MGSEIEMNMDNEPLAISGMRKPLLSVSWGRVGLQSPRGAVVYGQNGVPCDRCRAIDKSGAFNET